MRGVIAAACAGSIVVSLRLTAAAQPAYEETFDGWTNACIGARRCGDTALQDPSPSGVRLSTECARPGQCAELTFDVRDRRLIPFAGPWAPSARDLSVSFWIRLAPSYFSGDGALARTYVELVRAYCAPEPCNVLLELAYVPGDAEPTLYWQRERDEDSAVGKVCALPIVPTPGWHRVFARARLDEAGTLGECELKWDAAEIGVSGVSYAAAAGDLVTFTRVELGGASAIFETAPGPPSVELDDICIGMSRADVACSSASSSDASVPTPFDAGPAAPAFGFRGGGGCACSVGAHGALRAPVAGALVSALLVVSGRRARSRRRRPRRCE